MKQTSIPSTFDEATAKQMIGERVPGSVVKKPCDPYEFVSKTTGEIVQLDYRWVYVPEGSSIEDAIYEGEPEVVEHKPQVQIMGIMALRLTGSTAVPISIMKAMKNETAIQHEFPFLEDFKVEGKWSEVAVKIDFTATY